MTARALLPCPFCGGRAKTKLPFVRCTECGAQMCFGETDEFDSAIAAWNRRASSLEGQAEPTRELQECLLALEAYSFWPASKPHAGRDLEMYPGNNDGRTRPLFERICALSGITQDDRLTAQSKDKPA